MTELSHLKGAALFLTEWYSRLKESLGVFSSIEMITNITEEIEDKIAQFAEAIDEDAKTEKRLVDKTEQLLLDPILARTLDYLQRSATLLEEVERQVSRLNKLKLQHMKESIRL